MSRDSGGKTETEFSYFGVQATWGVTKHMGGAQATDELAALCQIAEGKTILEVGCGTGLAACRLAARTGCRVIGVDISPEMIVWAEKRARRRSVEERVQFRTADAQYLPFEEESFDAVISESVTAFPGDQQRAVSEYARVTRTGGYVGLNEGTWVKVPPPPELVEYVGRAMAGARFLPAEGWQALLEKAGLAEIGVKIYRVNAFKQRLNEMRGPDFQDLLDRLRGFKDFAGLYLTNPGFRKYAKKITPAWKTIRELFAYLGYGLYTGRKEPAVKA